MDHHGSIIWGLILTHYNTFIFHLEFLFHLSSLSVVCLVTPWLPHGPLYPWPCAPSRRPQSCCSLPAIGFVAPQLGRAPVADHRCCWRPGPGRWMPMVGRGLRGHSKGVASQKNTWRHLRTANGCQEKEEVVRKIEVSNWSEPECEGRVLASRIWAIWNTKQ